MDVRRGGKWCSNSDLERDLERLEYLVAHYKFGGSQRFAESILMAAQRYRLTGRQRASLLSLLEKVSATA